jgi:hypothetical protein
MKLTTERIETIEKYLLEWGLEYQDFYEEVLDHFIAGAERYMDAGEDFDAAFALIKKDFSGKRFGSHRGLKALETEYEDLRMKAFKKQLRQKVLLQFYSWRILVWVLISGILYRFYEKDNEALLWILIAVFSGVFLAVAFYIPRESFFEKTSRYFVNDHWEINKRKSKLLYRESSKRLMFKVIFGGVGVLILLLNAGNIFGPLAHQKEKPFWLESFQMVLVLAIFSFLWAFLELLVKADRKAKSRSA